MADLGPRPDERETDARTRVLLEHAQTGTELDRDVLDVVVAGLPDDRFRDWLLEAVSAARTAAEAEDSSDSVGTLAAHAEWVSDFGLPDLSLLLLGEAQLLAQSLSAPDEQDLSNVSNVTGLVAFKLGYLDIADARFSEALDLARSSHAGDLESAALLNQCNVKWASGDRSGAKQLARESLEAALEAGDRHGAVKCQLTLAHYAIDAKNVREARQHLADLELGIPTLRQPDLTASLHSLRGDVHVQEGNLSEAEVEYHLTLRAARRAHDAGKQVAALQNLGAVATDQGKRSLGLRRLKRAVALAEAHPMLVRQLGILYDLLARAEHEAGNPPEVLRRARQSLALAAKSGVRETTAMSLVGAALLENGEHEEGAAILEDVLPTLVEELAYRPDALDDLVPVLHNLILAAGRSGTVAEKAPALRETIDRLPNEDRAEALERLVLAWVDVVDDDKSQPDVEASPPSSALEDLALEALSLRPASGRAWAGLILGNRLREGDRPELATPVLRLALRVAKRRDQIEIAANLRNDLALSYADQGKWQPATRLLHTNHALAEDRRDRRSAAQALHNLSEIHRRQSHGSEALEASRRALDLAQKLDDSELAAESWLQLGLSLSTPMEDYQAARQAFTESLRVDRSDHVRGDNLAGLAGLAMVDQDFKEARSLYYEALTAPALEPDGHRLEVLLGLCEALARLRDRRAFNMRFQQLVDAMPDHRFSTGYAVGVTRSATAWSQVGKPRFSGEVLAICLILGAQRYEGSLSGDAGEKLNEERLSSDPLFAGVFAGALELARQVAAGEKADATRSALEAELARQIKSRAVVTGLVDLLDIALEHYSETDF